MPASRKASSLDVSRSSVVATAVLLACAAGGHSATVGKWESWSWISTFPWPTVFLGFALYLHSINQFFGFSHGRQKLGSHLALWTIGNRRNPAARSCRFSCLSPSRKGVWRNPVAQQNCETLQGGLPVLHRHGPLFGDVLQRQKQ